MDSRNPGNSEKSGGPSGARSRDLRIKRARSNGVIAPVVPVSKPNMVPGHEPTVNHPHGARVRVTAGLSQGKEGKVLGLFGTFGPNETLYRIELDGIERVIRHTYLEVVS